MRSGYALLGLLFLIIAVGTFVLIRDSNKHMSEFKIESPVFEAGGSIPSLYTCEGENINPPLSISNIPEGTRSLVLIMDDPDIPDSVKESRGIEILNHWIVFNISPNTEGVAEGQSASLGTTGINSIGKTEYLGPCPPDREHRYFFNLYALDTELALDESANKEDVKQTMEGHILEEAELIGRYSKKER